MKTTLPAISNAEVALVGLLCEGPKHPWQIEKDVQERDMRFWTDLSQSTIYKQLRLLEKAKLVTCREEVHDGRLRKVYSVTTSGRRALLARLRDFLGEPQHLKWRVDLALYNLDLLPKKHALERLRTYRTKLVESIALYRDIEACMKTGGCSPHQLAVVRRPVHLLEGEIRWVDEFTGELRKRRA